MRSVLPFRAAAMASVLWTLACMGLSSDDPEEAEPAVEAVDTGGADAVAVADDADDADDADEPETPAEPEVAAPPEAADAPAPRRPAKGPRRPGPRPANPNAARPPAPPSEGTPPPAAGNANAAPAAAPAPPPEQAGAEKPPAPKPRGIRKVGDRSWTVTKSLFQKWKNDPYKLGFIKEKGAGWQVRQVRQRHGYHLGVRGKDVVMSVNGHKLDTNAQLMGAYVALQFKKKFDVTIIRNGKSRVHHYEVVPD